MPEQVAIYYPLLYLTNKSGLIGAGTITKLSSEADAKIRMEQKAFVVSFAQYTIYTSPE